MRILVTGSAGFIGFHMAARLLADGHEVVGIDGFTPYYDPELKRRRHAILEQNQRFPGHELLLEDFAGLQAAYGAGFDAVYHFAAQAGVRYSLENPRAYLDANLAGTFNLLELMRHAPPQHALMASTSSVYGANASIPFRETDRADHPLTLYAATKKANEEMAHAYSHLFHIPVTMLRFFTVYGPWGRPDMALFKFSAACSRGSPIEVLQSRKYEARLHLCRPISSKPWRGCCRTGARRFRRRRLVARSWRTTACRRSRPGASSISARSSLSD